MTTWFFVSAEPDRITWPEFNIDHMTSDAINPWHYQTAEDACDAIRADHHGAIGKLYVIKAEISTEAIAERGWELVRKDDRK